MNKQIYGRVLEVVWIDSSHQEENLTTKPLGHILVKFLKELIGMGGVHR